MMKKFLITFTLFLIIFSGFSQIKYDNGGITDNGSIGEYTIQGNLWNNKIITYFFQNTTFDFDQIAARESVRAAFRTWQAQAHIYFIESCNAASADIVLLWGTGNHGDSYPFDGQNGVLAHAYYPPPNSGLLAGDVHFDDSENWSNTFPNNGGQPIDLQTVALHELGHSLGLAHSNVTGAIMYAYYNGSHRNLEQDDIDGVRSIYGSPINFITGSNIICGTIAQAYSISEIIPTSYSISWTVNTPLVILTQNTTNATITNNGFSGTLTLTTIITNGCGSLTFTKQIEVVNGTAPSPISFTPYITQGGVTTYMSDYCNLLTYICIPDNNGIAKSGNPEPNVVSPNSFCASGYITDPTVSSITWSMSQTSSGTFHGSYSFNANQFEVKINANYPNEWVILMCTRTNECGPAYSFYKFYAVQPPGGSCGNPPPPPCPACKPIVEPPVETATLKISVSPNPASGQFNVYLLSAEKNAGIKEIIIKNKMGMPVYHQKFKTNQKNQNINLYNQPTDIYLVAVFDGKEWVTQQLILRH